MQGILALPSPDLSLCDINGEPLSFVGPTVPPQLVVSHPSLANLAELRFRNPDSFQAGGLHNHVYFWENLISSTGYSCPKVSLLQIIREGVKVYDFVRHFKGNFKSLSRCPAGFRFPELAVLLSVLRLHRLYGFGLDFSRCHQSSRCGRGLLPAALSPSFDSRADY